MAKAFKVNDGDWKDAPIFKAFPWRVKQMESLKSSSLPLSALTELDASRVYETELKGFKAVVLENDFVRATVLPQIGGKLSSLASVKTGREFLLQPPGKTYAQPTYGGAFDQYDTSGMDECFPTITDCEYPESPFANASLPDHGELWSVPWRFEIDGETLCLEARGTRLPYTFRKKLNLRGPVLQIEYEVLNLSDSPIRYLYSVHPLLHAEQGATLVLPREVDGLLVHWSKDELLGKQGDICKWPVADVQGGSARFGVLSGPELGTAHKLFTPRLHTGACGIHFRRTREGLVYRFDTEALPYIGLWLCEGGWPSPENRHFTVALEPCTGPVDSLAAKFSQGEHRTLLPRAVHRWSLDMEILSDCDQFPV